MKVTLVQETPNALRMLADIAVICHGQDAAKNPRKLVEFLYKVGHHSVFEHVYYTFKIEGISRVCSHQIVRHRLCSFTQRSQRYCDESIFGYVIPDGLEGSQVFMDSMDNAHDDYAALTARGVAKEDARYVLPNAACTDMYMSCNLRELMHFCNERLCSRAQTETRQVAQEMKALVHPDLRWMLVPRCQTGYIICGNPCGHVPRT